MTQLLAAGGVRLSAMEIARFWSHINVGPKYRCWTWKGVGFAQYPYFRVWRNGKRLSIGAHVVALALKLGHDRFDVAAHSCDNKRCANPEHLSAGTYTSNLVESWERRRQRRVPRMPGQLTIEHAGGGSLEPTRADEIPFCGRPSMSGDTCCRSLRGRRACRELLSVDTDGSGRAVSSPCPKCTRPARGLCRECPRPIYSRFADYCAACRRQRQHKHAQYTPAQRAQKNTAWRHRYRADPDFRAHKNAYNRQWRAKNRFKVAQQKRRFLLRDGAARAHYLEYQRKKNAEPARAATKRSAALRRYYELHPVRPSPRCKTCGDAIAFTGIGRPKTRCDACVPPCILARRKHPSRESAA